MNKFQELVHVAVNYNVQEKRLHHQNDALVELARLKLLDSAETSSSLRRITEIAARTLDVERSSVWVFDDAGARLACLDLYEQSLDRHSQGGELERGQAPDYFLALQQERTIGANFAQTDPRTRELAAAYLKPLGIISMLDVPIRLSSRILGVLCHEHVGPARRWTVDEEIFAGSVGDVVALTLEASKLKKREVLQSAFLQLGHQLSSARTKREAGRIILELADRLWGWDAAFIYLSSPETGDYQQVLQVDTAGGKRIEVPPPPVAPAPKIVVKLVTEEGPKLVLRPDQDCALIPFGDTGHPSASLMFVPLRNGNVVTGIISIQSYKPKAYDAEALQALQALADHCAGALERINAEEALRQSEERFQIVARATNDALWDWDLLNNVGWSNDTFHHLFGLRRDEVSPAIDTWSHRIHPEDRERVLAGIQTTMENGGELWSDEYRFQRGDNSYAHVLDRGFVVRDEQGGPVRMIGAMTDITRRKQDEKDLRELPLRIIEAQERERRRVAHELHDEIGQILTGLKLTIETMERMPSEQAKTHLTEIRQLANDLIARVRNLSLDLRPSMLDDLGLLPTLVWFFDRYTAQTGIKVALTHEGIQSRRFSPAVETAAYRIMQEALTNVARHASVRAVSVILWADEQVLQLQIRDDGIGFKPASGMDAHVSSGLHGMRERALLLDGELSIESAPSAGTTVTAELPLRKSANVQRLHDEQNLDRPG